MHPLRYFDMVEVEKRGNIVDGRGGPCTSSGAKFTHDAIERSPAHKPLTTEHKGKSATDECAIKGSSNGATTSDVKLCQQEKTETRNKCARSGVRTKFLIESLRWEMILTQQENVKLRKVVAMRLPEHADTILRDCCRPPPSYDWLAHSFTDFGVHDDEEEEEEAGRLDESGEYGVPGSGR